LFATPVGICGITGGLVSTGKGNDPRPGRTISKLEEK
jgi:hypothetical protein